MDMPEKEYAKQNSVFALDIGTRSIIGVVGYSENGLFHIEALEAMEHPKRAMLDGQIEDINAVAAVANIVKLALEERIGRTLNKVCVAAAGRALRTVEAAFSVELPAGGPVTEETIYALEMGAVSKAADDIRSRAEGESLFCVGHSVARYYVDDYAYSTILDHKGKTAKAEIIATFLPAEVVNSLEAAMKKIGLSIEFLTLEPIAAMNAVIPPELRLLNLALVDIGAGTSDIAVCDGGTVAAYTMATVAGDEITEALIKQYLVDFETAEKMKFAIAKNEAEIAFRDILGFDYALPQEELLQTLRPALENLADIISEKIIEVNGKAPSAVFLVGGGGKTPLLCTLVANRLSLDERKVAIGGNNFMKKLAVGREEAFGPEYATPLGIALTALSSGQYKGFDVFINGEKRHLLRTGTLAMMDVLLLCGYTYSDVMGKSGQNLHFAVDGERRILRGGLLQPASLALNGEVVGISAQVRSGDSIHILPAVQGEDAQLHLGDLLPDYHKISVEFMDKTVFAGAYAEVNGHVEDADVSVQNGDSIRLVHIATLGDLLKHIGAGEYAQYDINGLAASQDMPLGDGDFITLHEAHEAQSASAQDAVPYAPQSDFQDDALFEAPLFAPQLGALTAEELSHLHSADAALPADIAALLGLDVQESAVQNASAAPHSAPAAQNDAQQQDIASAQQDAMPPYIETQSPIALQNVQNTEEFYAIPRKKYEPVFPSSAKVDMPTATAQDSALAEMPHSAFATAQDSANEEAPYNTTAAAQDSASAEMPNSAFATAQDSALAETPYSAPADAAYRAPTPQPAPSWQPPEPMFSPEPLLMQEADLRAVSITLNGQPLTLPAREGGVPYLFLDMLTLADIDPSKPQGDIELLLNGRDASFLERIHSGDSVQIAWTRRNT